MGERTEFDSPTSIAPEAPSSAERRVGLKFSPKSPETFKYGSAEFNLTKPSSTEVFTKVEIEEEAQKPAVLDSANIQELAARALEKARIYVGSIDYTDPMVLLEMAEIAKVAAGIVSGGGLAELSTFLASTALIKGVEFAAPMKWVNQPLPQEEPISKTGRVKQIAKQALIHHVEKQVAGKIVGKFLDN